MVLINGISISMSNYSDVDGFVINGEFFRSWQFHHYQQKIFHKLRGSLANENHSDVDRLLMKSFIFLLSTHDCWSLSGIAQPRIR